jgi:hypothetical protein
VRRYVGDAPVEEIFVWASIGGIPEQMVADHIRRIATLKPLLSWRWQPLRAGVRHSPVNTGGRRSAEAATPSR